ANGCSATSSVTMACPNALKEEVESPAPNTCCPTIDNISLYPNPNNGQFTIQSSVVSDMWSVEIYNVLGQKVYSQSTIHNPQFIVNISSQPNGMYLIRILDKDGTLVSQKKVVKTN
ncbi:MAG TPA: T9SS type A sorting domain-containing protein, partial [Bacteroidia bacterium]|nr:T9SS type A sorting domain-containing protein [Bacteroidia bacterium]